MLVRKLLFVQLVAVAVFLAGCSMPGSLFASDDECRFPSAPEHEAPGWVCGYSVPGFAMQATGQAGISRAGIGVATMRARNDALVALARKFGEEIKVLYENFVHTTGTEKLEIFNRVREVSTKQHLEGVSLEGEVDPEQKAVYVLVGIKEERDVEKNLKKIGRKAADNREFRDSINNERAAWQKYLAEKAWDRLEKRFEEKR